MAGTPNKRGPKPGQPDTIEYRLAQSLARVREGVVEVQKILDEAQRQFRFGHPAKASQLLEVARTKLASLEMK